ncbi:DUF1256 domain-containing protein, partial [Bacillus mycoides]
DALCPLVGTKLVEIEIINIHVFGTLVVSIHALYLEEKILIIQKEYPT